MILRICFVVASINELSNLGRLRSQLAQSTYTNHIIVIDEGNYKIRTKNRELLKELNIEFYGPRERISWFKKRFGSAYRRYLSVIPQKCHAETSFGFLVAWEEQADVIIELDDDVKPIGYERFAEGHIGNLFSNTGVTLHSKSKWYNTIDALQIDGRERVFPERPSLQSNYKKPRLYSETRPLSLRFEHGVVEWLPRL